MEWGARTTETLAAAGCCAAPGQATSLSFVSSFRPLACLPCIAKGESNKLDMIRELEAHGTTLLEDYWEECTPRPGGCGRCLSCSWRGSIDSLRDDFDPAWECLFRWPGGLASPSLFFLVARQQLSLRIAAACMMGAGASWRGSAELTNACSLLRQRRGLGPLLVRCPTTFTNIKAEDGGVQHVSEVTVRLVQGQQRWPRTAAPPKRSRSMVGLAALERDDSMSVGSDASSDSDSAALAEALRHMMHPTSAAATAATPTTVLLPRRWRGPAVIELQQQQQQREWLAVGGAEDRGHISLGRSLQDFALGLKRKLVH